MKFESVRWGGAMHGGSAIAGAAGWALLLAIVTADCTQERAALKDTAVVAPAGKLAPALAVQGSASQEGSILVLIRTAGPLDGQERAQLHAVGVMLEAVAGDVVTGWVPRRSLERLAALQFVKYVEPGQRLHPERERMP